MQEKYIDLLLQKCIDKNNPYLFINYDIQNEDFIDKLVIRAKELGIREIYLDKNDIYKEHEILKSISYEQIENHPYFNRSLWNEYAKKDCSFLLFRTLFPGVMDDIEPEKIARAEYVKRNTSYFFRNKQLAYQISWCMAALPSKLWAEKIFGKNDGSVDKLWYFIFKICMVDKENPEENWNEFISKNQIMINKLNNLKLKYLYYKNKLGTDLRIELLEDVIWHDAFSRGIVNMPSYEIYTTPHYLKTDGVVYSSMPLYYNGALIDELFLEFKEGKVINYGAKIGADVLKNIIYSDANSCYLGEVALVEDNSPISNEKIATGVTLIDENASCHLALGKGFSNSIPNGNNMTARELLENGINQSPVHVDFMIGTSDLEITGETNDGQKIKILDKGNFVI